MLTLAVSHGFDTRAGHHSSIHCLSSLLQSRNLPPIFGAFQEVDAKSPISVSAVRALLGFDE